METLQAIQKRRSVREYTGAPVPRQDLLKIVDAGRLAASGYNHQPWDFILITQPETIRKLTGVADWIDKAGAVVAVVLDPTAQYWREDGSAAIQNMLVAATALGYGSCWLQGGSEPLEAQLKNQLGVPIEKRLLTLVSLGVPAEWPTQEKKTLRQVVHWERW